MRDYPIEKYLELKHRSLDTNIINEIEAKLKCSQNEQDEGKANYYWFLRQVFLVQKMYLNSFNLLLDGKYEDAWNELDHTDVALGYLEYNTPSGIDNKAFNLSFIGRMIKEYQKLFPYHYFFSRETIIKKEKCSICGKTISVRNSCGHILGKVYMGELCLREVTDLEYKAMAIVTDPFDKYAMLHIEEKEYNYGMLQYLLEIIKDPYEGFEVTVEKRKLDEFKNIGRNELCPCGSGKKYKKCHCGTDDEKYNHYIVCPDNRNYEKKLGTRFFNTWKDESAE